MKLSVKFKKQLKNFELNMDFSLNNEILGILGTSGCGKSMTLKNIAGIITPDMGEISLDSNYFYNSSKNINLSPQDRKVGYLFQNYALFPNMTVEENIGIGLLKAKKELREAKIKEMIELFQLQGLEKIYPEKLSGGQQQRVALARILAYNPDVLLLDEPFSALDAHLKIELRFQLKKILENFRGICIIVSHDKDDLIFLAKNLMIINDGAILSQGKTVEILNNPINYHTAVLVGIKKISSIKKISENKIFAINWNIEVEFSDKISDNIKYIGLKEFNWNKKEILSKENLINSRDYMVLLEE